MGKVYEYTGTVEEILNAETFSSGFTKRDVIIGNEVGKPSKYPNPVAFTFKKEKCSLLDSIKVGQTVTVKFSISGRRWDGPKGVKYFTTLSGISIEANESGGTTSVPDAPSHEAPKAETAIYDDISDDMPF